MRTRSPLKAILHASHSPFGQTHHFLVSYCSCMSRRHIKSYFAFSLVLCRLVNPFFIFYFKTLSVLIMPYFTEVDLIVKKPTEC